MLISLHIENVAVIKSVELDFCEGFTALTGETGAGKSIIIDSINLLLGGKADRELIRKGEHSLLVSALFGSFSPSALELISENGLDTDESGQLFVQRTVTDDGRSQVKINGRTVSLSVLKGISSALVSIHGQNDTGALLDSACHLELVDIYANNGALLDEYRREYAVFDELRRKIKEIKLLESERERRREMLEYQIKDIDSVGLHIGEEEELVDRRLKIRNSEKIVKNSELVYKALRGSDKGSAYYLIDRSVTALKNLSGVVPEYEGYAERLRELSYQVLDISEEVNAVLEGMDAEPEYALNEIEERLDKLNKLKRKYGLTVDDILEYRRKAGEELDLLENSEELLKKLDKEEKEAYGKALTIANELHERRVRSARELEIKVKEALEFLDMPKVVFYADISEEYENGAKSLNARGYDKLEFYISANRGADAQSISKIASGGELARVMLALKGAIADKDGVETIIFDEIDSGVSGKTARKIGLRMREFAKTTQVFCVTHSAQIASLADKHFLISKSDVDGVTETGVKVLDYEGRVNELSRILGGINVTDAQKKAAQDMLNIVDY